MKSKNKNKALIIVDYQYDFCDPNGSLYVKNAYTLKPKIEKLAKELKSQGWTIIATKDFHPIDHCSFKIWNKHCVQNTKGSELYFDYSDVDLIIEKGVNKDIESYSGFFDDANNSNGLDEYLKLKNIDTLKIVGVATEICVKANYDDAIKLGYDVHVDLEYCKGFTD
ncbi:Pyrazinamidase/nicotinamidase [Mycoplasma mycoides subsp. capri LC str. 95010]|uniref:nicotinamidase n=1 Tax=Mycoplasma mycoides subsp. capri LC str. 95010 TaxID=862259 RepID=F4MR88_MYCML|nr:isochorismatase family protein [Mycoplasma mycoides]CBW54622.1 Pyrazinamidase/nicotinamidase [Mycoplasma mycoides subsp. capri LC str. 95010]